MIELSKAQLSLVKSDRRLVVMSGGWSSGKSFALAHRLVSRMLRQPGHDHAFWSPTMKIAKKAPLAAVRKALDQVSVKHTVSYPHGEIKVASKYGNIYLLSYHAIDSIRSFEVAHQVIDELDSRDKETAQEVHRQIFARGRGVSGSSIAIGTTPDAGTTGYCAHLFDEHGFDPDVELIRARTADNLWSEGLDEYIAWIREKFPPDYANAYLNGDFVNFGEGTVYKNYGADNQKEYTGLPDRKDIHVGLDFNVGGCAATIGDMDFGTGTLHFFDELSDFDTESTAESLKERYPNRSIWVYPDASGKQRTTNATTTDIAILRKHGLKVRADDSNPRVKSRVVTVNTALHGGKLLVDARRCPKIHKALLSQVYKNGEPMKYADHNGGSIDDWTDSLGYVTFKLLPITVKLPQNISWR